MIYVSRYKSQIGNILLASDEEGLTGLWFEGQKYFANTLPDERILQETEILREAKNGWMCILPEKTPHLRHLCTQQDQHSDRQCGSSYCRFPMGRRSHMERLLAGWLK